MQYQYTGQYSYTESFGLMYYGARWYDPYLTQFSQPDSIVPNLFNPQFLNRYSYALNNPIRYTDPSGHSVDCGMSDAFCSAGKYTPGGLIRLYRHYSGRTKGKSWNEIQATRDKLANEIDDYLRKHPDYNYENDPYLGFSMGDNRDLEYKNLRKHYWQNRAEESGACSGTFSCSSMADDLYAYYDEHESVRGPDAWDWSRVSEESVALDIVGIPLSLIGAKGPLKLATTFGQKYGYNILFLAGLVDSTTSLGSAVEENNPMMGLISLGSYFPIVGAFFDVNLLIWDLDKAHYYEPYTPPIDR
jgi:RHS repeat-associated protein